MPRKPVNINEVINKLRPILIRYNGMPSQMEDKTSYLTVNYYIKKYGHDPLIQSLIKEFNIPIGERRRADIKTKIEELRSILVKYNGIPSQYEDKAAYAKISYNLKKYGDDPLIQSLIEEFNLKFGERRHSDFDEKVREICEELKEDGKLPSVNEKPNLYAAIRYYFNKYADDPIIEKLRYIYAHSSCYPLPESKKIKPIYDRSIIYINCQSEYSRWKFNATYEYILFVYSRYSEFPGKETRPMLAFKKAIEKWYRYQDKDKLDFKLFISTLVEYGCRDEEIVKIKNSFEFDKEEVQKRINNLLIQHGACTIHYIAQMAIPDHPLPDEFVYYYYYNLFNKNSAYRGISPLGELYISNNEGFFPLYVHYRNLDLCDVDSLRKRVMRQNRNWEEKPPLSLPEWEAYGEYLFFIPQKYSHWYDRGNYSFDKPYPQKCIESGHPYFRYSRYKPGLKYLDYKWFLLNNGYDLCFLDDSELLKDLKPLSLANESLISDTDVIAAYNVAKQCNECQIDESGGIYIQTDEGLQLLFLPIEVEYYQVNYRTSIISKSSFLTSKDSLKKISFGPNIKSLTSYYLKKHSICSCSKLECIVIPPFKLKDYCKIFPKSCTTFFCNSEHKKLTIQAIYNENTLEWVPDVESFEIPNGVTNISASAFSDCNIKKLSIPGSVKEIDSSILPQCATIERISIGEGVKKIWGGAFAGCENLVEVNFPSSLETLYETFKGCKSLTHIHLKENLSYIGYRSFWDCTKLVSVTIDSHLKTLGDEAFARCESLKTIEFNYGIDELHWAFDRCQNLESIYFRGDYKNFGYGFSRTFLNCPSLKAIYIPRQYYDLFLSNLRDNHTRLLVVED